MATLTIAQDVIDHPLFGSHDVTPGAWSEGTNVTQSNKPVFGSHDVTPGAWPHTTHSPTVGGGGAGGGPVGYAT